MCTRFLGEQLYDVNTFACISNAVTSVESLLRKSEFDELQWLNLVDLWVEVEIIKDHRVSRVEIDSNASRFRGQ